MHFFCPHFLSPSHFSFISLPHLTSFFLSFFLLKGGCWVSTLLIHWKTIRSTFSSAEKFITAFDFCQSSPRTFWEPCFIVNTCPHKFATGFKINGTCTMNAPTWQWPACARTCFTWCGVSPGWLVRVFWTRSLNCIWSHKEAKDVHLALKNLFGGFSLV